MLGSYLEAKSQRIEPMFVKKEKKINQTFLTCFASILMMSSLRRYSGRGAFSEDLWHKTQQIIKGFTQTCVCKEGFKKTHWIEPTPHGRLQF